VKRLAWGLWAVFVLLGIATIAIVVGADGDNDEAL